MITHVIGLGTAVNVLAVVVGSLVGMMIGDRLPSRTRSLVTTILGIFVLVLAAQCITTITSPALVDIIGRSTTVVVLVGMILGAMIGAGLRVEKVLGSLGARLQKLLSANSDANRFVEGFVTASLIFCVGPLTVLGSINDGLGLGSEQLVIKSALDFFTAIAFASFLGSGVLASAVSVAVVQGSLTLLGLLLGDVLGPAEIDALTVAGGIILVALALRLLDIRWVPVGDLLPALLTVPLAVVIIGQVI